MPFINVKLIEDVFTPEQKGRIVEELTDAMVAIEGETCARSPGSWSRKSAAVTGESRASH